MRSFIDKIARYAIILCSSAEEMLMPSIYGFKYPFSLVDDEKLKKLCEQLADDPARFLEVLAHNFVESILEGNEDPKEKADTIRHLLWITKDIVSSFHCAWHPLLGNEFKSQLAKALDTYEKTGGFAVPHRNPSGYWEYKGAFTVKLVPGSPKDKVPTTAIIQDTLVSVSQGRAYQTMGGIQLWAGEQPFSWSYGLIVSIRDSKGKLLWLNSDYNEDETHK